MDSTQTADVAVDDVTCPETAADVVTLARRAVTLTGATLFVGDGATLFPALATGG